MENSKIYTIKINGVEESIKQVDVLKKQLDQLDARIKALEGRKVNVNSTTTSTSGGGSKTSGLSEEEKLVKEIEQVDAKRVAYSKEIYQNYLAAKDVLKETVDDQKQLAAAERLQADSYSNTMNGLKQKLADLKKIHFTTDLSSDEFQKQTKEISAISEKLKELEKEYGVYSRDVGNYANGVAEGLKKFEIEVNGVTRSFDNANQAAKTLGKELNTMSASGQRGTKEFKELQEVVANLNSDIKDATVSSQAMDDLLDTMESFGSLGQMSQGFSAFFGFDDTEIERSIQKLVGLQNAMQGLEKIRKQMQTQEGIGTIITKGFDKIDDFDKKLKSLNTSILGTGRAAKVAAGGIKLFTMALKSIATLGLAVAFDLLAEGVTKIVDALSSWVKGDAELIKANELVDASIKKQNDVLKENLELIDKRVQAGELSSKDALIKKEEEYARALKETRDALNARESAYLESGIVQSGKSDLHLSNMMGDKGVTTIGGFKDEIKEINDFTKRFDYLVGRVQNGLPTFDNFTSTVDDAKDELVHLTKLVGGDFVNAMNKYANGTKEGTKSLVEYIASMDELTSGKYSEAIKLGIDQGYFDAQLKNAWEQYQTLKTDVYKDPITVKLEIDAKINAKLDQLDPKRAIQREIEEYKGYLEENAKEGGQKYSVAQIEAFNKIIKADEKKIKELEAQDKKGIKSREKTMIDGEKELNSLRISAMKEGLNKTIKQLEEERRQKIAKIRSDGVMVKELELATNQYYNKKIEEAEKKHTEEMLKTYDDMLDKMKDKTLSIEEKTAELAREWYEIERQVLEDQTNEFFDQNISSYTIKDNSSKLSLITGGDKNFEVDMKVYIGLLRDVQNAENEYVESQGDILNISNKLTEAERENLEESLQFREEYYRNLKRDADEYENYLVSKYGKGKIDVATNALTEQNYAASVSDIFEQRLSAVKAYWAQRRQLEANAAEELYKEQERLEDLRYKVEVDKAKDAYAKEKKALDDYYKKVQETISAKEANGTLTSEEALENSRIAEQKYNEDLKKLRENLYDELELLQGEHNAKEIKAEQEKSNRIKSINAEAHQDILQELSDFMTKMHNEEMKSSNATTKIGLIDVRKNKQNIQNLIDDYTTAIDKIAEEREKLNKDFKNGIIDKNTYDSSIRSLDVYAENVGNALKELQEKLKDADGDFFKNLALITDFVGQIAQNALSSISDIISNGFEAEIQKQDEYIEKYEKLLDKQEEITKEHADKVNDIEDELSTARGDRRQHLIDQLNAEMAAQRASLAEEKRIEKEKQREEDKKKKLQNRQAEKQREMDIYQALISTSVAVTNGLATKPFWPVGVAMGALAASLGGLQVAAIMSRPLPKYGEGGLIQGKSHKEGGVQAIVGGTYPVELEGQEFITNRITTTKNLELLEYINTKKKRINLEDLIEFYGGNGSVRKNIQTVRTKFDEGGVIPTLNYNYQSSDRLLDAFEKYANQETVVSVVDIIDRSKQVNDVRVRAGLNP